MKTQKLRRLIPGVVALGVAGLLTEPAAAGKAMFRQQFTSFGAMGTSPGVVIPSVSAQACGEAGQTLCGAASLGATTPVAKFTWPAGQFPTYYTYSYTGYVGYTSLSTISSYQGKASFAPNNPYGPQNLVKLTKTDTSMVHATGTTTNTNTNKTYYMGHRMVFPTTGGNPGKNLGAGNPVTPTTTFAMAFDEDRAGSARITPGPNKFGGTLQFIFGPNALFKQKIRTLTGYYSRATGSFYCQMTDGAGPGARNGPLQACTLSDEVKIGVIGSSGMVTRHKYTSLGVVPIKTSLGVNNLTYKNYYLSTFAPFSTGMLFAQNPLNYKNQKFTATGYNKQFSPATSKVFTYTNTNLTTKGMTTKTTTMKTLMGITRITSLVRPRLRHTFERSNEPAGGISTPFQAARLLGLKVYFLPEPGGMLLIGAGMLGLAGLSILRRR